MATTYATPVKLRSGAWGARVEGDVAIGDLVTIKTRSGKTWEATVTEIVSSDDRATVCATRGNDRKPPRPVRRSNPNRCIECGGQLSMFDRRAASAPGYHFDCC